MSLNEDSCSPSVWVKACQVRSDGTRPALATLAHDLLADVRRGERESSGGVKVLVKGPGALRHGIVGPCEEFTTEPTVAPER